MYMAYGWPLVIPIEPSSSAAALSDRILYIKTSNRLLLVVTPTRIELWSSSEHKVRMGKYASVSDSIRREGENSQAIWSSNRKTIAVITSSLFLHIYKVDFSGKRLLIGGKQISGLCLANISLVIIEEAPFSDKSLTTSNFVCDNKSILLGLSNGHLQLVS